MKATRVAQVLDNLDTMEHTLAGIERVLEKVAELSLIQRNKDCYMYARWGHTLRQVIDVIGKSRDLMKEEEG